MAYTISDIADLVEYHLVGSAPDDDVAQANLVQLVQKLELLAPRPLYREVTWVFCDRCGCSVDTGLYATRRGWRPRIRAGGRVLHLTPEWSNSRSR